MDENHRHKKSFTRKSPIHFLFTVLIALSLTLVTSACSHREYWDSLTDQCLPCTRCNKHQIVIRPCQRHMDTVCRAINSVEIDWGKSVEVATGRGVSGLEIHSIMFFIKK
jgi:TNFR/NGFR cysteine-rich region